MNTEGQVPAPDVLDTAEAGRRVVLGGAVRIVGYGVGLIASLIGAAAVIRHLGPVDYGRFSTVLALVTAIQIVTDLGMTTLGVREYAQRTGRDRDHFMGVLLGMRLLTTFLLLAGAGVTALVLGYDDEMILGALLLGISAGISALASTVSIPLIAEIRMGLVTGIDVARQVVTAAAYVALAIGGAGIVPLLGVSIPIYAAVLAVTVLLVRHAIPLRPVLDWRAWSALLKPTLTFALASAAGSLYVYGAMVVTELVTNDVETGFFGAAFRVYIIVSAFPVLLVTTAFPVLSRAARDDHERLTYATQRLLEGTALLGGAALIGLVLGAEPIMTLLGSDEYDGAVPVLRILGVALALTFMIAAFGFTLMALHRHRAIIVSNAIALTVSATAVVVLGSAHGASGAATGVLLGEATLVAAYLTMLAVGRPALNPTYDRLVRIIPPLALALGVWFLPIPAVAQTVLGLAVYAGGLVVLRAVPDELRALIPRRPSA